MEVTPAALSTDICQHKDHCNSAQSCLHSYSAWVGLRGQEHVSSLSEGGEWHHALFLTSWHLLTTCSALGLEVSKDLKLLRVRRRGLHTLLVQGLCWQYSESKYFQLLCKIQHVSLKLNYCQSDGVKYLSPSSKSP